MTTSRLTLAICGLAAATFLAAGCGSDGDDDVPADAVAVINGQVITKASFDEVIARAKADFKTRKQSFPKVGTPEYQSLQSQIVSYLVSREQIALEAEELGLEATDAEIDAREAEITTQLFGGKKEALQKALDEQGYTPEMFRDEVRLEVLQREIQEKLEKDVNVTDADVKKYYDENKSQYVLGESREVRHILVKTKAEADDVVSQLAAGASFAELAKKLSQDPGSAESGGKLTIRRGETVPPFDKAAFALAVNKVSEPVKTDFGWHVIEPVGPVKPGTTRTLAEAKEEIRTQLLAQRRQEALSNWSQALSDKYKDKITYGIGFAPPATSDDESTGGEGE